MSADSPIRWLAGDTRSRSSPAKNPVSMPVAGPCVSPSATTSASAMSGTLPPGSGTPSISITCSSTATSASTMQVTTCRMSASGAPARPVRCDHPDDIERSEVGERAYQGGPGQPRADPNLGDRADRNAGHIRPVANGCGHDQPLPGTNCAARAKDAPPTQVRAGEPRGWPRNPAHRAAADEPAARHRRRVGRQQDGAGPRAHAGDGTDQARRVEHSLFWPDAVAAADVEGDGLFISLTDRDYVRGATLIATLARKPQHRGQLGMICPLQLLGA